MTDINIDKLSRDTVMEITVHLTRQFRLRLWLSYLLIRLAARVLDCDVEIKETA